MISAEFVQRVVKVKMTQEQIEGAFVSSVLKHTIEFNIIRSASIIRSVKVVFQIREIRVTTRCFCGEVRNYLCFFMPKRVLSGVLKI